MLMWFVEKYGTCVVVVWRRQRFGTKTMFRFNTLLPC